MEKYVSKVLWHQIFVNYFYDRTKAIFFGENILLTKFYIGCHSVGENMECFGVYNNVFVLQATQSINSPNLEASRLQVHFLQYVKLHVFGEDIF